MAASTSRVASSNSSATTSSGKGGGGDADGAVTAEKKSKKKLMIMIVVGLLVVGLGAKMTVLKKKPTAAQAAAAKAAKPPAHGPIVELTEQTLNLADGHFLKLQVVIQFKLKAKAPVAPAAEGGTTAELVEATQIVHDLYTGYTQPQLTGVANQDKVKLVLAQKLDKVFPTVIDSVLTPEFLMSS